MPQPERKMLGRLVLETPAGHREVLSDLWSDQPLKAESLLEAVTRHVGGALDRRPSTTDIRSHDPGSPAPIPVKPPQIDKAAEPKPSESRAAREAERPSGLFPPTPTKRQG